MSSFMRRMISKQSNLQPFLSLEEELFALAGDDLSDIQDDVAELSDEPVVVDGVVSSEGFGQAIDQTLNLIAQNYVLRAKHVINGLGNLIASTDEKIEKYSDKLKNTQFEYDSKRPHFVSGEHRLHLNELWYFFIRKNGATINLIRDLQDDVQFSQYALDAFPTVMLKELRTIESGLSKLSSANESAVARIASELQKVKTPAELFDRKYLGDERYFDVVSVELVGDRVREFKSKAHRAGKAIGGAYGVGPMSPIEVTTPEIQKIIDAGKTYIASAQAYRRHLAEFRRLYTVILNAFERMNKGKVSDGAVQAARLAVDRLSDYKATLDQFSNRELIRSIKGARYTYYAALRLTYNATKYIK